MKVYGHPMSTCTRKVLTTLAEKGHEAEVVTLDFAKGEHKSPEHLARQPFGVVPVLEDGDFQLYESRAIIRYLDQVLPGVALTPADAKGRARMEQWMSIEYSYMSGPAMRIVMQAFFAPMRGAQPDAAIIEQARKDLKTPLDVAEKHLASNAYLAGDAFSLADITWMPYLQYVVAAGSADLVTSRPNVAAWWERVSTRPSWKKVAG